ncbi:MAG: hypothetical protein IAI50_06545 [Candidatus Eremiobacteraeota bacterium]|nr:hypothetical protein [Candidatus Eremiobacteraeota bacterium]
MPAPLPTLLSQVLVAYTIEFDNEAERSLQHRTTTSPGARHGPWLVSLVMYANLMRLVPLEGTTVGTLEVAARTKRLSLAGMERWGYITVDTSSARSGRNAPRSNWIVRPTSQGRHAQQIWRGLFDVVEKRWSTRFGDDADELRRSLTALAGRFDRELPDYVPVLGYGFAAENYDDERLAERADNLMSNAYLSALLSQVLLNITIDFERDSPLSLAMCSGVVRLLGEETLRVRDLPRLAGVSKEAIAMALSFLEKGRYVSVGTEAAGGKLRCVRLTPKGREAKDAYEYRLTVIKESWQSRYGRAPIARLREALERCAGDGTAAGSPLFCGLTPYPENWLAAIPRPETLPHYPLVLHRGGYPDGA